MKGWGIPSNIFLNSIKLTIWLLSFILLTGCITLIGFWMLTQCCISGIRLYHVRPLKALLVSLLVKWWLDGDVLKCLDPISLSVFPKGFCMYVLVHVFNVLEDNLQLGLGLHFLLVWRLKVSQRREVRASLDLSWASSQPCACVWNSRFPEIYWHFSQPPVDIPFLFYF